MQDCRGGNPVGNQWTSVAALEWLLLSSSTKSSWTLAIQSAEKRPPSVSQLQSAESEPEMPDCSSTQAETISSAIGSVLKPVQVRNLLSNTSIKCDRP